MSATANTVADIIIDVARAREEIITNLKLQKLLYYTQAWHLVLAQDPLFPEAIEAWVHGPVVPAVFRRFRDYRWSPITEALTPADLPAVRSHIDAIYDVYGRFTATDLERLTHQEFPWVSARAGLEPDIASHNVISHASMRAFYAEKLETHA